MKTQNATIAIYLPSLRGGGAERVMVTLANAFAERGYAVDLVLVSATGPYLSQVSSRVNVVNLGRSRVITSLPGLTRYLRKRKPVALLSAMSHANLVALLAQKLACSNTRVVASERSNPLMVNREQKSIGALVIRSLNWFLYRTAAEIHAVSHGVAAACAEQLGLPCKKIAVVYNPVITEQILDLAKFKVDFSWLGKDQKPLILAAGSLTKPKDFPALICAFGLLRAKLDARLVILGEGELRLELQKVITEHDLQDSVVLPGFLHNPFPVMKQADLFVLSSAYEGLPNALIQAMACGTPVVSTDCPSGPSEILENGKWGRLVPVGNVEALAQAMLDTLAEPKHPDVARRAAYFSVERAVDGYLRLLLPEEA